MNLRQRRSNTPRSSEIVCLEDPSEVTLDLFLGRGLSARYNASTQISPNAASQRSTSAVSPRKRRKVTESYLKDGAAKTGPESPSLSGQILHQEQLSSASVHKHDNLRRRLIKAGVWYENVDDLISICEGESGSGLKKHDNEPMLKTSDAEELTLAKASQLLPGLRMIPGQSKTHRGSTSNPVIPADHFPDSRPAFSSTKSFQSGDEGFHRQESALCGSFRTQREMQTGVGSVNTSTWYTPRTSSPSRSFVSTERFLSPGQGDQTKPQRQSRVDLKAERMRNVAGHLGSAKRIRYTAGRSRLAGQEAKTLPLEKSTTPQAKFTLLRSLRMGIYGCSKYLTCSPRQQLYLPMHTELKAWKKWKGGSHDVLNVSWSPNGTSYAAGTAALTDRHTMQYNRPNNLLFGNIVTNTLTPLPDHRTPRPCPEQISSGLSPVVSASSVSDPWLYQSVSALSWSSSGERLFSASYDGTCKIWDARDTASVKCMKTLKHENRIDVMALSKTPRQLLATGVRCFDDSVRVYAPNEAGLDECYSLLSLPKRSGQEKEPFPHAITCLQFGCSNISSPFLIAGFASDEREGNGWPAIAGALGLWQICESNLERRKVTPFSQNVFDAVWAPNGPYFATGNAAPSLERKRNTINSQIRIYNAFQNHRILEFDCMALDMNAVTFCEFDVNYVTASCTDNSTYVFDSRRPDQVLHRLQHAKPLSEAAQGLSRELTDVGARVALWGSGIDQFLTGGSDGNLKMWDIRRSSEDAFLRDVATLDAEIMSGQYSADKSNLLLGDGAGGINLLSIAPLDDDSHIEYLRLEQEAPHGSKKTLTHNQFLEPSGEGQQAAREMVSSGQLVIHPKLGAVRGPHYKGPFARWARPAGTPEIDLDVTPLLPEVRKSQFDKDDLKAVGMLNQHPKETVRDVVVIDIDDSDQQSSPSPKRSLEEKERFRKPLSKNIEIIDLTVDDSLSHEVGVSKHEAHVMGNSSCERDAWWNDGEEWDSEDHYFPPHRLVGANLTLDNA